MTQENELEHLRVEVDRLQRENIDLRDKLSEMTRIKNDGWERVEAAARALGYAYERSS